MDLSSFLNKNLFEAGQNLFNQLGIKLNSSTSTSIEPKNVLKDLYKDRTPYNLISESYFLGLIDDNLFNDTLFTSSDDKISFKEASQKIDNKYKGIIVYAVNLKNHYPNRTQLSELTRAFNRASKSIPVILLTFYKNDEEQLLSFSTTERTQYEQTWREGEKTGKVSLLRDIRLTHTHTGHKKILLDLKIDSSVKSFDSLYKQWQEVFNVQLLNKKFFQELANWYFWATTKVNFPDDVLKDKDVRNATNVIRLLTRLIFVWFIKEKGLIREELFDENSLRQLMKFTDSKKSTYYKAILQNLFFATLNTEKDKRKFRGQNDNGRDSHYFIHNVFRYKSQFNKPQETLNELFDPIPFLNGGLFECLDKEIEIKNKLVPVRIDGFSDRDDNPLKVPDELFFSPEKEVDLNKIFDTKNKKYKVRGLINLLSSYKFTIAENTPLEEDIALDPELLGKVFENLLANYNPETQTTARKQTGSFYTPREIVNYMVDESLIAHLKTKMLSESFGFIKIGDEQIDAFGNIPRKGQLKLEEDVNKNRWIGKEFELEKELRNLISYSESEVAFTDEEKKVLIKSVDSIKVLDPACGSGAFPMGVLHKLVLILHKLDPKNSGWKKRQIERAESIEESSAREEAINKIENAFEKNELDYGRKLYLIENCIYGIDIQPIAAQISKLRFFISLIVDQKVNWGSPETNYDIEPLPNLETKFVAANTLIGIERPEDLRFNKAVELKETELRKNRERYFTARTSKTKERYRNKDKELREEIVKLIKKDFEEFAITKQNQIKEKQKLVSLYSKELDKTYEKQKDKKLTDGQKKILEQQAEKQLKAIKTEEKKITEFESQLLDSSVIDETASTLASWDPYDQNASASFFDVEWMFGLDGFQVVIGNPPYLVTKDQRLKEIYKESVYGRSNLYGFFIHCSLENFLHDSGILSFINPRTILTDSYFSALRKFILKKYSVNSIVDIENRRNVFESVLQACILNTYTKQKQSSFIRVKTISKKEELDLKVYNEIEKEAFFYGNDEKIFLVASSSDCYKIFKKLIKLKTLTDLGFEFVTGKIQWDTWKEYLSSLPKKNATLLIWAENIQQYFFANNRSRELVFINKSISPIEHITSPTIIVQRTTAVEQEFRIISTYIDPKEFSHPIQCENHTSYLAKSNPEFSTKFLLSILNSKIMDWFFRHINSNTQVSAGELNLLPLPNKVELDKGYPYLVVLVEYLLLLRKCDHIGVLYVKLLIDAIVYELYFPEEIKAANCNVIKFLNNLHKLKEECSDDKKLKTIEKIYKEFSDPKHPVSLALQKMQEVEEVKIIEGKNN